ncbi:MAG: hypothetical protein VR74_13275 [Hyphomonas sp. BRH_c22]|uniref:TFIIB-type zinc ribbon-containing protein n=1 Tax=Hyphomonas sp. BRH_c22 TaxID=1629710 RepID=UPI0005F24D2D|nr:zf-TFIIB domain-containing protein [Hyphomonas sp. BRH_c22]KJS36454.1 MAG: hypothetical protein VR74_13275 [Hyphomonas sp. BRH_c22]
MKCPVDNETLVMADRSGVEIDYCPKCRGVWLDRGELDKIIERAVPSEPPVKGPRYDADDNGERGDSRKDVKPYRKKRESFLGELFDF